MAIWRMRQIAIPMTRIIMASDGVDREDYRMAIHVAPDGDDRANGRSPRPIGDDGPLATVAAARDRIRDLRAAGELTGPIEVLVQAGRYELTETLRFDDRDLADPDTAVTYRAVGEVRLSGSRRLDGFAPLPGETGPVVTRALTPDDDGLTLRHLCYDGTWLRPARYPSFQPDDPVAGGWSFVPGELVDIHSDGFGEPDSFPIDDDRPATWSHTDGVEVVVFPRYNYGNDIVGVATIEGDRVRLAAPASSEIYPGDRYHFQHVLDELDQPGEWCLDRAGGRLVLYPPGPVEDAVVETPVLESIIVVEGTVPPPVQLTPEKDTWFDHDQAMGSQRRPEDFTAGHLTFSGFTLEGCFGDAVVLRHVRACRIVGCTIRTAAGFGVRVWSGAHCEVTDCDVRDVGKGGIEVAGGYRTGFSARYESCGHRVSNNHVHHYGQQHAHVGGIAANGVGITIDHNTIHDGPRWGVLSRGNTNVIEYNHIHHVCLESADTAAIYLVDRDFTMRGTVIRHNHIHDVLGFDRVDGEWTSPAYAFGIYLDDFSSGVEIRGNLIHGTPRAGVYLHAGQDNVVEENLCLGTGTEAIYLRRWPAEVELRHCGTHGQALRRNTVRRNVLGAATHPYRLSNLHDHNGNLDLATNDIGQNLVIGPPGPISAETATGPVARSQTLTWQQWLDQGHDVDSVIANWDEIFADGQLRPDGPAAALGIKSLPSTVFGVQPSTTRASWPIAD